MNGNAVLSDRRIRGAREAVTCREEFGNIGLSPSGKARDFDSRMRWFKSSQSCHRGAIPRPLCASFTHRATESIRLSGSNFIHHT